MLSDLYRRAQVHAALGDAQRLAIVELLTLSDAAPSELGRRLGLAGNLLAHHLDVLEEAGLLVRTPSHGDGRRKYLRLDRRPLGGLLTPPTLWASSVLFVCSHNSARSQLAAAYWNHHSPVPATSAGSEPAEVVHPQAVEVAARRRPWPARRPAPG